MAGGGAITFTAIISYGIQPTALGYAVELPAGWSYASGTNEPSIKPDSGTTGTLEWAYTSGFGTGSSTFTFVVNYPAGLSGGQTITASAVYRTPLSNLSIAQVVLTGASVNIAPAFTTHPTNQTVTAGGNATFTAAANGSPAPTLQWQVSTNSGSTWENLSNTAPFSGVTTATLTITGATAGLTGYQYRCVATNSAGAANSNAAIITVNNQIAAPSATLTSAETTYVAGGGAITFTATISYGTQPTALGFAVELPTGWSYASGTNEPSIKPDSGTTGTLEWAYTSGFGTGSSTFTFVVNYPAGLTGSQTITASAVYRTPLSNLSIVPVVLTAASVTIAPAFTTQPTNQTVTAGTNATFTAAASGMPTPSLQWQVSTNSGSTWANLDNTTPFSGVTTGTLTITGATIGLTGYQYRCVATNSVGSVNSNPASLTVQTLFAAWQAGRFTPADLENPAISGPNADPDFDGFTNLVEYALGLLPKSSDTMGLPELRTTATDWIYTYTRPASVTDVTYTVEMSTDLATWTTVGVTNEFVSSAGGTETWRARFTRASAPKVFFRLRVSLGE